MRIKTQLWVLLLVSLLLFDFDRALAEEEMSAVRNVRLLLTACPEPLVDATAVVNALRLELLEDGIEVGAEANEERTLIISVDLPDCDRPRMQVSLRLTSGEELRHESVDLSDRPIDDRARLLALTLAEILRSIESLRTTPTAPSAEASENDDQRGEPSIVNEHFIEEVARRAAQLVTTSAESEARRPGLLGEVFLGSLAYLSFNGMGFGGRLGISFRPAAALPFRLGFDAGYRYGESTDVLGVVTVHQGYGSISLVADGGRQTIRGEAGLRLEAGWGWATGHPVDETILGMSINGFLLTPSARFTLRVAFGSRIWLMSDLAIGYGIVGINVTAEGRRVGGIGGPILSASVGFAFGSSRGEPISRSHASDI